MSMLGIIVVVLIVAQLITELWLARLNEENVRRNAAAVPEMFHGVVSPEVYEKSIRYTLAKSTWGCREKFVDAVILAVAFFSGFFPWLFTLISGRFGTSVWASAGFLFVSGILLALPALPFSWHAQFRLEESFGFNTTTPRLWWMDRVKGLLLGMLLGLPLLALILKLIERAGDFWWVWAWSAVLGFQLLLTVLAPLVILPLFNKFTPLPEGPLRERLLALGKKTGFQAKTIQVMDGSKRSRHSNAFFTGFGKFRKIVLFDTLLQQLGESELEAVLAHEIGHYKKRHIPKMLLASAVVLFLTFLALGWLLKRDWFFTTFGFVPGSAAPALLIFGLLSGVFTFWTSPFIHALSRRFEYEADAYAAETMKETSSLIGALRLLNEKNLSNLTPHPLYSGFYYSHPALIERENALRNRPT